MNAVDRPRDNEECLELYTRAIDQIANLESILRSLAQGVDPMWNERIRQRLDEIWTRIYEAKVNGPPPNPSNNGDASSHSAVEYAHTTTEGLHSFLSRKHINERDLRNRARKAQLCLDIILLFLLANDGKDVTLDDTKAEFQRLGIAEASSSIAGRFHRMRRDTFIDPAKESGSGRYNLSSTGKTAAERVKSHRLGRSPRDQIRQRERNTTESG